MLRRPALLDHLEVAGCEAYGGRPAVSARQNSNRRPSHQGQRQGPAASHGTAHLPLPSSLGEGDPDLPGKPGLGLGNTQGPLPGKAEAGDTAAARHLDSWGATRAYTPTPLRG